MLKIITGPVGSGKTGEIMARLATHVRDGGRAIFIVPEQASFMAERDVYTRLGVLSQHVRVTSFTRLSEQVIGETGGSGVQPLDAPGRYLLMAMALEDVSDLLKIYRRHTYMAAFVDKMVETLDELRSAGIGPEELARIGRQEEGHTGPKLGEMALIMDAYEALVGEHYADSTDLVNMAAGQLAESGSVRGTRVFIDSFAGFTAPEYRAIEAMLAIGCPVDITLCLLPNDSRYEVAQQTFNRLWALSERMGLGKPVQGHLNEAKRFVSEEVAMVAEEALAPSTGRWAALGRDVGFYKAKSPYDELAFTAAEIGRLVREEGYRYRDITVMTRDLGRYAGHLRPVFARYGIPLFVDVEEIAAAKLLPTFLAAALKAAVGQEGIAPFLQVAKSPALGIDPVAVGEFENYCFVWSMRPVELSRPFTRPIDGFSEAVTDRQQERLALAENCRRKVWARVSDLRAGLAGGRAADCARGVYELLESLDFGGKMDAFSAGMAPAERRDFLDEQALLWDAIIGILDLFGGVMADVALTPARFAELFGLCVAFIRVAMPPRTLDEVTVGTVDRIRPDNPSAVFILGAVEREFPRANPPERLLGEGERQVLNDEGYDLIRDTDYLLSLEEYNCCLALGGPSRRLYISYPAATATGEALEPSQLYLNVRGLFVEPRQMAFDADAAIATPESAFMALGGNLPPVADASLRRLLTDRGWGERLGRLEEQARKPPRRLAFTQSGLFGGRMRLSPTQLERYYSCPFQYFMRDGLGVRPRRRAELSPLESGNLVHEIVNTMVTRHGGKGLSALSEAEIRIEVDTIARDFVAARAGEEELSDSRLSYLVGRMVESGTALVRQLAEEFAQSLFEPVASELPVGLGGVEPLSITTPDGRRITVEGRVDRVDIAEQDGQKYVRVVDYKSGGKRFALSDIYHGLNMQMLIYLFAIWQNGEGELAGAQPAGVLYMPTTQKYLRVDRDTPADKIAREHQKTYKMNGLILDDPMVLLSMEPGGEGIFIPRPTDRSAVDQLASLEEMGRLMVLVEQRIGEMSDYLGAGLIEARPAVSEDKNPCEWCDYQGVCGFEAGDQVHYLRKMSREDVMGGGPNG